jgi:hypothetical protein
LQLEASLQGRVDHVTVYTPLGVRLPRILEGAHACSTVVSRSRDLAATTPSCGMPNSLADPRQLGQRGSVQPLGQTGVLGERANGNGSDGGPSDV